MLVQTEIQLHLLLRVLLLALKLSLRGKRKPCSLLCQSLFFQLQIKDSHQAAADRRDGGHKLRQHSISPEGTKNLIFHFSADLCLPIQKLMAICQYQIFPSQPTSSSTLGSSDLAYCRDFASSFAHTTRLLLRTQFHRRHLISLSLKCHLLLIMLQHLQGLPNATVDRLSCTDLASAERSLLKDVFHHTALSNNDLLVDLFGSPINR